MLSLWENPLPLSVGEPERGQKSLAPTPSSAINHPHLPPSFRRRPESRNPWPVPTSSYWKPAPNCRARCAVLSLRGIPPPPTRGRVGEGVKSPSPQSRRQPLTTPTYHRHSGESRNPEILGPSQRSPTGNPPQTVGPGAPCFRYGKIPYPYQWERGQKSLAPIASPAINHPHLPPSFRRRPESRNPWPRPPLPTISHPHPYGAPTHPTPKSPTTLPNSSPESTPSLPRSNSPNPESTPPATGPN